jgi:hypothetical protein
MDDDARGDQDRVLRVQLELHLDSQPIRGRLRPEQGAEETFVGWLGFVEALDRSRVAATTEGEESSR